MRDAMARIGWSWIKNKIFIIFFVFIFSILKTYATKIDPHSEKKIQIDKDDQKKADIYEDICNKLEDPDVNNIDLRNIYLNKEQLEGIWIKLEHSNIGHISWGPLPQGAGNLVNKIENKIIQNNKKYKRYPNDFIHGLLSLHSYKNSTEGDLVEFDSNDENKVYNQHLGKWKVHKVFRDETSGYYSVLYINRIDRQAVLSHRGTTVELSDLLKKDSPIHADIKGILGGEIVAQQAAAFSATEYSTAYARKNHYNLSITGHSLGAWLAELSIYYCHRDFAYTRVKTVTFDSPGSVMHVEKGKSNIINHTTDFDIRALDIVVYLSSPNFVNSCNQHVGKVYRIFPEIPKTEFTKNLSNFIKKVPIVKNNISFLEGFLSISGHSLNFLLKTFDPVTGKPLKYEQVLDWPSIKYIPSGKMGSTLLDLIPGSKIIKATLGSIAYKAISDTTVVSLLTVIDEFIRGNINQKQYWETFKHIHGNTGEEEYAIKETLCSNDKFSLAYEGHYRTVPLNTLKEVVSPMKGSTDWYLSHLAKYNIKLPGMSGKQLDELKNSYTIEIKDDGKEYISANTAIEDIRDQITRLIEVNPEIKDVLDNPELSSQNQNISAVIENYLPQRPVLGNYIPLERIKNFSGREEVFKKLDQALENDQCVVLSGFGGIGKSSTALEYAYRQKSIGKIVRWLNADSKVKLNAEYRNIAKEMNLKVESLNAEVIQRIVNSKIGEVKSQILFIFDNVEKYEDAKTKFINLPDNVKVLITARSNNLQDNIQHINLEPFSEKEAHYYIKETLKEKISYKEINDLLKITGLIPYKISKAIAYIKNNKFTTVRKDISNIKSHLTNDLYRSESVFLFKLLNKTQGGIAAWHILQYAAYLDPDFISIDLIKDLLKINDKKLEISVKALEDFSLVNLSMKNENYGLQIHRLVQQEIMEYRKHYPKKYIPYNILVSNLLKTLNNLFPEVGQFPGADWKRAEWVSLHSKSIMDVKWRINPNEQGELYLKLSVYHKYVTCNFEKSLEYGKLALKTYREIHPENHPNIAKSLNNIGSIYNILRDGDKGLEFNEQALNIWKTLVQGGHPYIAKSLYNLGYTHQNLGKFHKALEFLEQSLKIFQELYHGKHSDIASNLHRIGLIYYFLGDLQKALKFSKQALKMEKELHNDGSPETIKSLRLISTIYYYLSPQNSINYLEHAIKMNREIYQYNSPGEASILNDLGWIHSTTLCDPRKALSFLEQALKVAHELYQDNNETLSIILGNLGALYRDFLDDPKKSLTYFDQALKMQQELYHDNYNISTVNILNDLGKAYIMWGDPQNALLYLEKALKITQKLNQNNYKSISISLCYIGMAYITLGDYHKSLTYLDQALKMQQELYQGNHFDIAETIHHIGMAYIGLGEYHKALIYLEQSITMNHQVLQKEHILIADTLNKAGMVYGYMGDIAKEVEFYKKSYIIYSHIVGKDYSHTRKLYQKLKHLSPEFLNSNESRSFIVERGNTNKLTLKIKEKIQFEVLNPIHELAAKGSWHQAGIFWDSGVLSYLKNSFLQKKLENLFSPESVKIAIMLCFEAINLGIMESKSKDYTCVLEFSKAYPNLIKEIAVKHPEYFVDGSIMKKVKFQ